MFDKIALVSIPVKDQKVAKTFYTEVLGCKVVLEMPFGTPDTLWIRLALPGAATEIVLVTWFPQMTPGCVQGLVITTKDIIALPGATRLGFPGAPGSTLGPRALKLIIEFGVSSGTNHQGAPPW